MTKTKRNARIASMVMQGMLLDDIAETFGICRERVRQIAGAQGVRSSRGFDRYTPQQTLDMVAMHQRRGMSAESIAVLNRRSSDGVRRMLIREGVFKSTKELWSKPDESFLVARYKKPGWSFARIARELGRTRNEVAGKAYRLGLMDRKANAA